MPSVCFRLIADIGLGVHFVEMSLLFSLVAALAASAFRTPPDYASFTINDAQFGSVTSREHRACLDESGGVTAAMRDCSAAEAVRLDAELNREYRAAISRLNAPERARLRQLQREWLRTRWVACDRSSRDVGGTLALLIADGCGLEEVARRTLWLRSLAR